MATQYWIHPAIGISRVGKSDKYYLSPDFPGQVPNEGATYKDTNGDIKKQVQKFRIYEYNVNGNTATPVKEITSAEATITWSVHLVNRKAWLDNYLDGSPVGRRNHTIHGASRNSLIIDSKTQTVTNGGSVIMQGSMRFATGKVQIGEIKTDSSGRLMVFPGSGEAGPASQIPSITRVFDNDKCYDTTCDGVISATIKIGRNDPVTVDQYAWILCSVPGYAPAIENMVTLRDAVNNVAYKEELFSLNGVTPSFFDDIYPILNRTVMLQWTSFKAMIGHPKGSKSGDFTMKAMLQKLANPSSTYNSIRQGIMKKLTKPAGSTFPPYISGPSSTQDMPLLNRRFTITELQYDLLKLWADGNFTNTQGPNYPSFDKIPIADQPKSLDAAAADSCLGGSWNPGIETWAAATHASSYGSVLLPLLPGTLAFNGHLPLRINKNADPNMVGYMTVGVALPWQTDFNACGDGWWPAQRPNQVFRTQYYNAGSVMSDQDWVPWRADECNKMVTAWQKFGFIVKDGNRYVETERAASLFPSPPSV